LTDSHSDVRGDNRRMKNINAIIVGAQKAGTTSLKNWLAQHPGISTHQQIEFMYFIVDDIYKLGYLRAYKRYFIHCNDDTNVLLAKNVGIMSSYTAIRRLHEHNPDVKVIVVLRNPVDRAYSAYWYALRMGWENVLSFDEAVWMDPYRHRDPVAQRSCAYLERGIYVKHLREIYRWFPEKNVQVYLFENLKERPIEICQEIYRKLRLPSFTPDASVRFNLSSMARSRGLAGLFSQPSRLLWVRRILRVMLPDQTRDRLRQKLQSINKAEFTPPPMNPKTRAKLIEFFRPYNEELEELLGLDLSSCNE
jgi:hypothetical protein